MPSMTHCCNFGNDDRAQLQPYQDWVKRFCEEHHRVGLLFQYETALLLRTIEEAAKAGPVMIEIGTYWGYTAQMIGWYLADHKLPGVILSIDPGVKVGTDQKETFECGHTVFVRGTSADVAAAWTARPSLVFVDGCHCTSCVTADINAWAPKILPGGFLVFHDVTKDGRDQGKTLHGPHTECGVGAAIAASKLIADEFVRVGSAFRGHMEVYQKPWQR